jgi:hypothetical protein
MNLGVLEKKGRMNESRSDWEMPSGQGTVWAVAGQGKVKDVPIWG